MARRCRSEATAERRTLRTKRPEQLLHRLPRHRIHQVRRNLRERLEHEAPLAKPRMRHEQAGLVDDRDPPNRIRSRSSVRAAPGNGPLAAALALDRQQRVEQRPRAQRRLADGGGVEKSGWSPVTSTGDGVVVERRP